MKKAADDLGGFFLARCAEEGGGDKSDSGLARQNIRI
jgi:hypothetical protein